MTIDNIDAQRVSAIWGQAEFRDAIKAVIDAEMKSTHEELRSMVARADHHGAAIAEGKLQAYEGLPKVFEQHATSVQRSR